MAPKALVTILLVIFSGALLFLLVVPQLTTVRELQGANTRLRGEVELVQKKISSTKSAIATFEALEQEDIARVESALPRDLSLPNLLVLVESLISSSGLIAQDIDVRPSTPTTSRAPIQASSGGVGTIAPRFLQQPGEEDRGYGTAGIAFSVVGTYESFKAFLEEAERSLRIFDVESIAFSSPASEQGIGGFRFSVKMDTYFSK